MCTSACGDDSGGDDHDDSHHDEDDDDDSDDDSEDDDIVDSNIVDVLNCRPSATSRRLLEPWQQIHVDLNSCSICLGFVWYLLIFVEMCLGVVVFVHLCGCMSLCVCM